MDPGPSKTSPVDHGVASVEKQMTSVLSGQAGNPTKPVLLVEARLGDGGARRAELMQESWGKHGKFWVFFGLCLCMLA